MLRDRYAPVDLFALAPALTLEFEPVLARLDVLLDDDVLFQAAWDDLSRRVGCRSGDAVGELVARFNRAGQAAAQTAVARVPADAWTRRSAGDGRHGPRWYDWGWIPLVGDCPPS